MSMLISPALQREIMGNLVNRQKSIPSESVFFSNFDKMLGSHQWLVPVGSEGSFFNDMILAIGNLPLRPEVSIP